KVFRVTEKALVNRGVRKKIASGCQSDLPASFRPKCQARAFRIGERQLHIGFRHICGFSSDRVAASPLFVVDFPFSAKPDSCAQARVGPAKWKRGAEPILPVPSEAAEISCNIV